MKKKSGFLVYVFLLIFWDQTSWGLTKNLNAAVELNCNALSELIGKEFTTPYKVFQNEEVRSCVSKVRVSDKNLTLFLASAFYYQSPDIRKRAFIKLNNYNCGAWSACRSMYGQIDAHIRATALSDSSLIEISKADQLRVKSLSRVNEFKNSVTVLD